MTSDRFEQSTEMTALLMQWSEEGNRDALNRLLTRAWPELRRMARARLGHESPSLMMQSTDLVNAAWLRLGRQARKRWENRGHFFAVYSQAMFQILVNEGKRRRTRKRQGQAVPFDERWMVSSGGIDLDMIDFAMALDELSEGRPRAAEVAKLRHLAGMTIGEIAKSQSTDGTAISAATVRRDLKVAEAHLYRRLRGRDGQGERRR